VKDKSVFFNPFRILSPKLNEEALRLEELHTRPFSESVSLEEGLLIMISKAIEMTRLLSKCIFSGSASQMDTCGALGKEIHQQEKVLTTGLVQSDVKGDLLRGLLHFPFRLERIGDLLEGILKCSRRKVSQGIPLSDKAHAELDQLFEVLLDIMRNLRDAITTPNKVILEYILSRTSKLSGMLEDFQEAHWARLEAGFCSPDAGALYLEMLDSIKEINSYLRKMSNTLLELGTAGAA